MSMRKIARHTWLFSFTDVAFLLLLVWTQLARMNTSNTPVAEMQLPAPVVVNNPELTVMRAAREYRQVLIDRHSDKPYLVTRIVRGNEVSRSVPMSFTELNSLLKSVHDERRGEPRPVVVPLPESFSSDLLQATALIARLWNERGGAVVHLNKGEEKQ
ncbi:MAG TPA: hypothetical protein VF799_11625 [Geobacteraceae bacterium]